jgi:hypothetical protein
MTASLMRDNHLVECHGANGYLRVAGSFQGAGAASPAAANSKGRGWSVARTSVGLYTITFSTVMGDLISALATVQVSDADFGIASFGDSASKTLQLRTFMAATTAAPVLADLADDANERVSFEILFRKTSLATKTDDA